MVDQLSQHHVLKRLFYPLYMLAYFVEDKTSIDLWIYLWAFYSVPLIYISVFVPVPYCLHANQSILKEISPEYNLDT